MDFNKYAKKYDKYNKMHFGKNYNAFREKTVSNAKFEDYDTILEFGCGTSLCFEHILDHKNFSGKYIGVDISIEMLKYGSEKIKKRNIENEYLYINIGKNSNLPIQDNSVDAIFSSLVLHLLSPENRKKLLNEYQRVLKPNGKIFLNEFGLPTTILTKLYKFYVLYLWGLLIKDEKHAKDLFDGKLIIELKEKFKKAEIVDRSKGIIEHIVVET